MRITAQWLRIRGACEAQVYLFSYIWPQGCDLTEENLQVAWEAGLQVPWLANHIGLSTKEHLRFLIKDRELQWSREAGIISTWSEYDFKRYMLAVEVIMRHSALKEIYENHSRINY